MNSNLYRVPHLQNNSYLYPYSQIQNINILPHQTHSIETQVPRPNYSDELDLPNQKDLDKPHFSRFESKPKEVLSIEPFQNNPLNEIKLNFNNFSYNTGNFINEGQLHKENIESIEEKEKENKQNELSKIKNYALNIPLISQQKIYKPSFGCIDSKNQKNEESYNLPSFRSENYYNREGKIQETFADSLLHELEKSQKYLEVSKEYSEKSRESRRSIPRGQIHPDTNQKYKETYNYNKFESTDQSAKLNTLEKIEKIENSFNKKSKARPSKRQNHFDESRRDTNSFSLYSESSYSKEDYNPRRLNSKGRNSLQPSFKRIKPSREVYIEQVRKVPRDAKLDLSKLKTRGNSSSSRLKPRNSNQNIDHNKKITRSACNSKEKSAAEKEVFVEVMMKVLKNHAKNCKSLRHEIDKVKFSKFFNV